MQVTIVTLTEKEKSRRDYRNMLSIKINGERVFSVHDGEPEDATLARDFNDCWHITKMMKEAHLAGRLGEPFELLEEEEDE